MEGRRACSAAPGGTAAVWRKRYGTLYGPQCTKKSMHPLAGWARKLPPSFPSLESTSISLSCADTRSNLLHLKNDHSGHERAFGADASDARRKCHGLARPAIPDIRVDNFNYRA